MGNELEVRMHRTHRYLVVAAIFAVIAVAGWLVAQDRSAVVPEMTVLLDNECVRVQYHDVAVGQTIPMHSHPKYVVYTLKAFEARITLPDGSRRISKRNAGEAYWNEAITHSVENLGSTDIHNLIIELKAGSACH
jgi:quercetin dioxygenase-like cupin family protein